MKNYLIFALIILNLSRRYLVSCSEEDFEINSIIEEGDVVTTKLDIISKEEADTSDATVSSTTLSSATNIRNPPSHERCHWGTPECHYMAAIDENSSSDMNKAAFRFSTKGGGVKNDIPTSPSSSSTFLAPDSSSSDPQTRIAFSHKPPDGFVLTAHVLTDPTTGLSYFAESMPSQRMIPFQECGAFGSSTEPIPMKQASFQHFPASAHPSTWSSFRQSKLVVALSRIEITVSGKNHKYSNSTTINKDGEEDEKEEEEEEEGETRIFEPGDVVLMEDFGIMGHKMRAAPTITTSSSSMNEEGSKKDLSILILTPMISNHHYSTPPLSGATTTTTTSTVSSANSKSHHIEGDPKKKFIIKPFFSHILGIKGKNNNKHDPIEKPCHWDDQEFLNTTAAATNTTTVLDEVVTNLVESKEDILTHLMRPQNILHMISPRKVLLGSLGLTLSTGLAYFLSKVAPLQLAVGIGGTCLIAGGTWGAIQGGEWLCDELENWVESKRLEQRNT